MGYGFAGHIGIAKESSWGSGVAATDYVEALSEDLTLSMERFSHKSIIGTLAEPDDTAGLRRVEGNISFTAHPVSIGYFLKGALQTKSVSTVGSSLWRNDFFTTATGGDFSSDVPLQPYTFEVFRDVTSSHQYTGCVIDALTLTFEPNNAVMCEASIIGRGSALIAKTAPVFPGSSSKPFTFDTVSLGIAGAGTVLVETLSVEINNNLEGIGALNQSLDIAKVRRNNHQMVNISGTMDFTNVTEYLNFVNQTEQRMTISVTKANSFAMVIDMPRVVYTAFPMGIPGKERVTVEFEGKAFYHAGSGTAIKVSLTTTQSLY
jgi:hypothetical protein